MPDLRAMEVLLTIARTGSIGAAATELGLTQQAVSSRLRSMEALVGVPLVARTRRGSHPTATGDLLVQWATRVLDAAEQMDAGISALRSGRRSNLRIAASLTFAEYLLPTWLVALQAHRQALHQPTLEIAMTAANSERVAGLVAEGAVDLGFVEGPTPPPGLSHRLVAVDELVVVVGVNHPWARQPRRPVSARKLAETPLVTREAGSGTRTVLERALRDVLGGAVIAKPALELSNTVAVKAAVIAGAGPSALSELAVREDIAAGRLVAKAVSDVDLTRQLLAVWPGGRQPQAGPARDLLELAVRP